MFRTAPKFGIGKSFVQSNEAENAYRQFACIKFCIGFCLWNFQPNQLRGDKWKIKGENHRTREKKKANSKRKSITHPRHPKATRQAKVNYFCILCTLRLKSQERRFSSFSQDIKTIQIKNERVCNHYKVHPHSHLSSSFKK